MKLKKTWKLALTLGLGTLIASTAALTVVSCSSGNSSTTTPEPSKPVAKDLITLVNQDNKTMKIVPLSSVAISKETFNSYNKGNILSKVKIPSLSPLDKADLTVSEFTPKMPNIKFRVKDKLGKTSDLISVDFPIVGVTPAPSTTLSKVSLAFTNNKTSFNVGENIEINATTTPTNLEGVTYSWKLVATDGTKTDIEGATNKASISFKAKVADYNKQVEVTATKDKVTKTATIKLNIIDNTATPPTETLIQRVNKVIGEIQPIHPEVNQETFDAITDKTVLSNIIIPGIKDEEKGQLKVSEFNNKSAHGTITFKVSKDTETSELITVKWTISAPELPPAPVTNIIERVNTAITNGQIKPNPTNLTQDAFNKITQDNLIEFIIIEGLTDDEKNSLTVKEFNPTSPKIQFKLHSDAEAKDSNPITVTWTIDTTTPVPPTIDPQVNKGWNVGDQFTKGAYTYKVIDIRGQKTLLLLNVDSTITTDLTFADDQTGIVRHEDATKGKLEMYVTDLCGKNLKPNRSNWTSIVFPESLYSIKTLENPTTNNMYDFPTNFIFAYNDNIKSLTIPKNLKIVGLATFERCKNLTDVTINSSIDIIESPGLHSNGERLFQGCHIETLTFGENVETISKSAFEYCELLSTINWPTSLKKINEYAFRECKKLGVDQTLVLPDTIEIIKNGAFEKTGYGVQNVTIANANADIDNGNQGNITFVKPDDTPFPSNKNYE